MEKFDFCGWATRHNVLCTDGKIILQDAFKDDDGKKVPLVWMHQHDDPTNVLGHAILKNTKDGVYAYCKFNPDTEQGKNAKMLVAHGDVEALSIYANKLKTQKQRDKCYVQHGVIRELSLVLAGANPGAFIDEVMSHGEGSEDGAIMSFVGINLNSDDYIDLSHADEAQKNDEKENPEMAEETKKPENSGEEKTIQDVYNEFTDEQKEVVHYLVGQAYEEGKNESNENDNEEEEGDDDMKHNVFDQEEKDTVNYLSHSDVESIFKKAKSMGSLKESYLAHAGDTEYAEVTQDYGINGTSFLYPEASSLNVPPEFIKRDMGWVAKVIGSVHHTPFSRIKSMFADITEEDARAKGYLKGKKKKEEVFGLLKRTTTPTTIYKKQKLDRDDIVDITDFDVVAWIKAEMRMMLDEEKARAILIGDGRSMSSDDKINEQNIRPIWKDEDLYTIKADTGVSGDEELSVKVKAFIQAVIRSRKEYKGSGEPTLYTTETVLTECLLLEDSTGRVIYDSIEKLKNALRVKDIVTVPVMEGAYEETRGKYLLGIVVNLKDYNVGADKGGAVNMFDDFDIDYNAQKYLIETRCSGALIKPHSAIAIEACCDFTIGG